MTSPDALTPHENAILLGLIREGVRKARRNKSRGVRRWRDEYDATGIDRRIELLMSMYERFGGDPRVLNERMSDDLIV